MSKKVYVIIPSFNEAEVIQQTLEDLIPYGYHIVVVDDASTDQTKQVVAQFPVAYLRHKLNLGQGAALQTGISYALKKNAEVLVTFDADGQHTASDIATMIAELDKGSDIVFGTRFLTKTRSQVPMLRRGMLHFARYLNFVLTGILLSDAHNGLRVMSRKAATLIQIQENRMAHATEILILVKQHQLKYCEVPVHIRYTDYSLGKGQSIKHSFKVLQDIFLYKIFK